MSKIDPLVMRVAGVIREIVVSYPSPRQLTTDDYARIIQDAIPVGEMRYFISLCECLCVDDMTCRRCSLLAKLEPKP